eukprot:5419119-Prymnesium_polylepis.1
MLVHPPCSRLSAPTAKLHACRCRRDAKVQLTRPQCTPAPTPSSAARAHHTCPSSRAPIVSVSARARPPLLRWEKNPNAAFRF